MLITYEQGYAAGLRGEQKPSVFDDAPVGPRWLAGYDTGLKERLASIPYALFHGPLRVEMAEDHIFFNWLIDITFSDGCRYVYRGYGAESREGAVCRALETFTMLTTNPPDFEFSDVTCHRVVTLCICGAEGPLAPRVCKYKLDEIGISMKCTCCSSCHC